jgi:hypothetical protein
VVREWLQDVEDVYIQLFPTNEHIYIS